MHTHAGRYACNPQLVICGGPLTPVSGGVGSSQHSDLRGHQRIQCSQGRPRGIGMCPSTWTPPPGTSGGSTNTLPSPGEGWRSWVAPASSSASRTGAHTDSDGASFVGGVVVVVEEGGREGSGDRKSIHPEHYSVYSFPNCVALFNHRATEERRHTHCDVTTYFNLLGDRQFVDACVFLNMCESEGNNKAARCDSYANK